jgi:hypothetical protein
MSPCNKKEYRFIAAFGRRKIRVASGVRNWSTFEILSHKTKVVSHGFRLPRYYMMSSFFCDVTQPCLIFSQTSFVTTSQYHLQGSRCPPSVVMDCGQLDNAA